MGDTKKNAPRGSNMNQGIWARLARAKAFKQFFPISIKRFFLHFLPWEEYHRLLWQARDQYADTEEISTYPAKVDIRLGIIKEFEHGHKHYIGACRDLGVPYRLVDISGPDWIDVVKNCGCDVFLVWPSGLITAWKQMFDERLKVIVKQLGKTIYPTYDEMWIYESKRRMHYWLEANKIPHPKTWVFYNRQEALGFAKEIELPVIIKIDLGSGASGVRIFQKRSALLRFVRRCFGKGIVRTGGDSRDRQWGSVVFQEYLPDVVEWRIIRMGDSYFGHQKLRKGEFHSGSGKVGWYDPPKELFDFVRSVTDAGRFTSMDLDIFETGDGRFIVNELQCVFGSILPYQMLVNGRAGRYLYESSRGSWAFEEGIFCQNACCNLRVEALVRGLGHKLELPRIDANMVVRSEDQQASIRDFTMRKSSPAK
jgi:hypothetical protein